MSDAPHRSELELENAMEDLYNELRRLAGHFMRDERTGHTMQPTALISEAYLRLARQDPATWKSKTLFKARAARIMRQVLCDHARKRGAKKRGAGARKLTLHPIADGPAAAPIDVLVISDLIESLTQLNERSGRIAELRIFADVTMAEAAEILGLSKRTAESEWQFARAWLRRELLPQR